MFRMEHGVKADFCRLQRDRAWLPMRFDSCVHPQVEDSSLRITIPIRENIQKIVARFSVLGDKRAAGRLPALCHSLQVDIEASSDILYAVSVLIFRFELRWTVRSLENCAEAISL